MESFSRGEQEKDQRSCMKSFFQVAQEMDQKSCMESISQEAQKKDQKRCMEPFSHGAQEKDEKSFFHGAQEKDEKSFFHGAQEKDEKSFFQGTEEKDEKPSYLTLCRLRIELSKLCIDPPAFCRPAASPMSDLFHFEVVIDGPDGSPYAGGTFPVAVDIPHLYPMIPPKLTFLTKVYHPNIHEQGQMVLDVFQDQWSPSLTVYHLLLCIVSVLIDPLLDRAINRDIADQYRDARDLYEATARDWTQTHASTPIVSYCTDEPDWDMLLAPYCPLDLLAGTMADYVLRRHLRNCALTPEHRDRRFLVTVIDPVKRKLAKQFGFVRPVWNRALAFIHTKKPSV